VSTKLEIPIRPSHSGADVTQRWLVATSCLLWLVVAAATVYGGLDDDDGWEAAYAVYSVALTMAAAVVGSGLVAFFVGNATGIGHVDSYGDRPLAGDVSVVLSSLITAAAAWLIVRSAGAQSHR
jgi:hypothetical protein